MNRTTKMTVAVIGVILAIAGMSHGFFEILRGNTPTDGLIIQAIGDEQQMWLYGTEEAFSLIPNFLVTGILAMLVSLAIAIWSIGFVWKKGGTTVLGLLFVLLLLVGGGIAAQILIAPFVFAAATRINRPLTWWSKILPNNLKAILSRIWLITLVLGSLSFLIGLFIAVTGYIPEETDSERILHICWALVFGGGLGFFLLSMISGFARDIQNRKRIFERTVANENRFK